MAFNAFGLESLPFYQWYEMQHAALGPFRAGADATRVFFKNPGNPFSHTTFGKAVAAGCELFERATRRYAKPDWDINHVVIGGMHAPVFPRAVWERPFCKLIHFERAHVDEHRQPKMLIVAPMSAWTASNDTSGAWFAMMPRARRALG